MELEPLAQEPKSHPKRVLEKGNFTARKTILSKGDTPQSNVAATLERRIARLQQENEELKRHGKHLQAVIDGLTSSVSWRLTAPLRKVSQLKRLLWPLLRSRAWPLTAAPLRGIEQNGSTFTVTGPGPSLLLQGEHLPSAWVRIEGQIEGKERHLFAFLYYSETEAFSEAQRIWLRFEPGEVLPRYLRLPSQVRGLRLDPFLADGSFTIHSLRGIETGFLQILYYEVSKQLRFALTHPRLLIPKAKKALSIARTYGIRALGQKLISRQVSGDYHEWVDKYDSLDDARRDAIRSWQGKLPEQPKISVVMPVYNPPIRFLDAAIDSVKRQLYPNWELCIADDNSTDPQVRECLERHAVSDKRIKLVFRQANGHIGEASNSALALATGDYVALLDHDDELHEAALALVAREINAYPNAGLLYSDEDKMTEYGLRFNPYFKCDWNPDLFLAQNYICHLTTIKASLIRAIGGFRTGFDGAQDWDLYLRVIERLHPEQIRHIPYILYHWRVIEGSTAQSTSFKPYAQNAQVKAVAEHLSRIGRRDASVRAVESISQLRVEFPVPSPHPQVTLIIPTRDKVKLLKQCISSITDQTNYDDYRIVIVDNGSEEKETLQYFSALTSADTRVSVMRDDQPFNFSRLNNRAVRETSSPLVGFLNNDLEVIDSDWLRTMVSHAIRPEVGAVGARLLYPNNLLQHGGIILGIGGVAGHNHKARPRHDPGYFNRAILTQNLSAVTAACLIMRRNVFEQVNGFNERLDVAFNDVDLCLRIRAAGYWIVYAAQAELYHHESASRGYENTPEKFLRFEAEIARMKEQWKVQLYRDPFYSPNLTLLSEDFSFAFPPRVARPWEITIDTSKSDPCILSPQQVQP